MNREEIEYDPIYDLIVQQVKDIDTKSLSDDVDQDPKYNQVEKQIVYIWIRLYIKEELSDLKEGDNFSITYLESGEKMITKFICFGKKNSFKDSDDLNQIQMIGEDDTKCLCLMVNEDDIQNGEHVPFIRTLFRTSKYFEYQVYRREDLEFRNERTGQLVEYIDCDF
jgi:hypothetical protein